MTIAAWNVLKTVVVAALFYVSSGAGSEVLSCYRFPEQWNSMKTRSVIKTCTRNTRQRPESGITKPNTLLRIDWMIYPENFDWMVKSGAFWLRYNGLLWSEVEPQEGTWKWSGLSELEGNLVQAAQLNQKVIMVVRSTPDWAQAIPGHFCGPIESTKLAAFGDFMHELVKRYSQPPYSVKFWEIGNEPDIDPELVAGNSPYGCWGDADDEFYGGGRYADMLATIYPRIKSADPEAQVLVGGLLWIATWFILLRTGTAASQLQEGILGRWGRF
jgi:hypothetical protein